VKASSSTPTSTRPSWWRSPGAFYGAVQGFFHAALVKDPKPGIVKFGRLLMAWWGRNSPEVRVRADRKQGHSPKEGASTVITYFAYHPARSRDPRVGTVRAGNRFAGREVVCVGHRRLPKIVLQQKSEGLRDLIGAVSATGGRAFSVAEDDPGSSRRPSPAATGTGGSRGVSRHGAAADDLGGAAGPGRPDVTSCACSSYRGPCRPRPSSSGRGPLRGHEHPRRGRRLGRRTGRPPRGGGRRAGGLGRHSSSATAPRAPSWCSVATCRSRGSGTAA